jgi:DNA-binding PadR family transcriptional regulator
MKAELLILGVLHRGNLHPYEIKRRLTNAMVQCFTDVDVGTLYYAVRQLSKNKLIAPVSQKRVVRGGIKTVYRITPSGRRRFQQLLHGQFSVQGTVPQTLYVAMLFLHLCDLSRVAVLLREKMAHQKRAIDELHEIKNDLTPILGTGALHLLKHIEAQRKLDLAWLQSLSADVESGRVHDSPAYSGIRAQPARREARLARRMSKSEGQGRPRFDLLRATIAPAGTNRRTAVRRAPAGNTAPVRRNGNSRPPD